MRRKYFKEIVICLCSSIVIVLFLLVMVTLFEKYNIHVSGSREMWMGLIGAIIGGMYTLIGVLITIYRQQYYDDEKNRMEHMPIMGFEVVEDLEELEDIENTLSCCDGELLTSAFTFIHEKICSMFIIKIINGKNAFDFTIEGCMINGKEMILGEAFAPASRRLVDGESVELLFDYSTDENAFCIIRFSYKDIFGNKYYQDLPFIYLESEYPRCRQVIEIRDIKPPILVGHNVISLADVAQNYIDYDVFCK